MRNSCHHYKRRMSFPLLYIMSILHKLGATHMGKAIIVKRMSNPHTLANCVVTTFLLWLVAEILNVNIACKHRIKLMTQRRSVCLSFGRTTLNFTMLFIVLNIYKDGL